MHSCMQEDQNGQKTMVLQSADKTRLTRFILSNFFISSKQPSLKYHIELALISKENRPVFISKLSM
jgi:hypothetical protein